MNHIMNRVFTILCFTRTVSKGVITTFTSLGIYLNFGTFPIFQRVSENLDSRALGLRVEKVVRARAEEGGEGGAEGV